MHLQLSYLITWTSLDTLSYLCLLPKFLLLAVTS